MIESHYDWQVKDVDQPTEAAQQAAEQLKIDPMIAQILINRGYDTIDTMQTFLTPDLSQLHDPFAMHDMQKGVDRIQNAIMNAEKVTIYGDYDADGVTSTAIMYETLDQFGANVDYFIPNRFVDGYGPNTAAFERLIEGGTQLIVTVDNGVSGHDAIARANELGCDVVVTDHHELPETLPDAAAVIHPRHPEGDYPFGGLSGAGVAFKVATALLEEVPQELLDLAAIGTVADLVPVVDENRVLVSLGLKILAQTDRLGLVNRMQGAGIDPSQLTEQSIGFGIAPRLNALGRLDDAAPAVELLTTLDDERASELAQLTEKQNKYRQQLVADISETALTQAQDADHRDHPALVITGEHWHEGVLGIVASKVVETMGKPTVVLNVNPDSNTAKGSGRSVAGFNLFEAFDGHRDLMVAFGGHAGAVGMTAKADQLTALQTAFDDAAETQHLTDQPKGQLNVAARLTADKVTMPLYEQLQRLAPFGTDNPVPLFAFDPETLQNVKAIGADGKHLKFKVEDNGQAVDAIDFGQGALAPVLASAPDQVKLLAQIDINVWQGRTNMQLMVKDIAVTGMVVEDKRTQQLHKTMFSEAGTYVFFNQRVYEQLRTQLPPTAVSIVVTAGQEISDQKINTLFLVDCPASIADLQRVLGHITADRIVAYFYLKQSHYLLGMPERAQYAKLFRFVKTHQNVDVGKRMAELAAYLKIDASQLVLMLQIFSELHFVTIENGQLTPIAQPANQKIETAPSYQSRQTQIETEKQLLYSESAVLKQLLTSFTADK
ncbi:single-stranded-DNA-specific exonuclease RecJ [Secundilactobacillus paracollinoides]|uniref:Single-stranded-DNA-specific exonuclease RecJ n=1 Tax=Secundilactobacillus paracollinoides TaxID=240427 RepID=A0A1B2J099_9LACO|nr:single-stranded-DNA-specific exonuclease RecJ [Secundilactobacillus paracollinoides]ANZ67756.1 single-stranded-DNA-specific exonuclease RecJ [Secundilactobacillus paracollinoides]